MGGKFDILERYLGKVTEGFHIKDKIFGRVHFSPIWYLMFVQTWTNSYTNIFFLGKYLKMRNIAGQRY